MKEVITAAGEQQDPKYQQHRKKSILQYIWDFFVSVRVAIVIIVIIAISAIFGTIIPQEDSIPSADPANYYPAKYGAYGKFMYKMGFTSMYTSWWFLTLLLLLAISLVICSWERIVPLYKALQHQVVKRSVPWLKQRNLYAEFMEQPDLKHVQEDGKSAFSALTARLIKKGYKVRTEPDAFLAEKGRISRFGPYILHIGILIVIIGAFTRVIPGWYFNTYIEIPEGESRQVPHTDFSVRNDKFSIQYYNDGRPSMYETKATIVQQNKDVKTGAIQVNHDLQYKNVQLFQSSYDDPFFQKATITFSKPGTSEALGSFSVDFKNPQAKYQSGPYTIQVLNYFPDFKMVNGQPATDSNVPLKPTFVFQIEGPGITAPKPQVFFAYMPILSKLAKGAPVDLMIQDIVKNQPTVLRVHKDLGIPIVYFGCLVVMVGLVITFYYQQRLVWGRQEGSILHVGAQTNKNTFGLQKELERVAADSQLMSKGQSEGGTIFVKHK